MKKILFDNKTSTITENGEAVKLQYSLIEDEIEIDSCSLKCYGFEIKKTSLSGSVELSEIKQIPNVFFNRHEASAFLKKVAEGKVTPIALSGILEDYISEAIHSEKRLPVLV